MGDDLCDGNGRIVSVDVPFPFQTTFGFGESYFHSQRFYLSQPIAYHMSTSYCQHPSMIVCLIDVISYDQFQFDDR
jgi:hypothetical protein